MEELIGCNGEYKCIGEENKITFLIKKRKIKKLKRSGSICYNYWRFRKSKVYSDLITATVRYRGLYLKDPLLMCNKSRYKEEENIKEKVTHNKGTQ